MQIVKVKDIKSKTGEVKTGARAGQAYELIIITGEDGSEFTTFDTAIKDVGIGGTLELEFVIKSGKTNITKFEIKEKGSAASPPGPGKPNGAPDMTKADWSLKDRLDQWSREANACFMGLPALLAAKPAKGAGCADEDVLELQVWRDAMKYAKAHFATAAPAPGPASKGVISSDENLETTHDKDWEKLASGSGDPIPGSPFKNAGDFLTRATKELGMTATGICIGLGVKEIAEVTDFTAAWAKLKAQKANAES